MATIMIKISLGMHEITLHPVEEEGVTQETLVAYFTWHRSIRIFSWTLASLAKAADGCDEEDHIRAERQFIRALGGHPEVHAS